MIKLILRPPTTYQTEPDEERTTDLSNILYDS